MPQLISTIIVGAGSMGQNHMRTVRKDPRFRLAAIVDTDSVKVTALESQGIPVVTSIAEVPKAEQQFVIIATPTSTHAKIIREILAQNSVPLLVEKPISSSSTEGTEILSFLESKGALNQVYVGHVERSNPVILKLKEVLNRGWLGEVLHLRTTRQGPYPGKLIGTNDVLLDLAVHDFDLFGFLLGGKWSVVKSLAHHVTSPKVCDHAEILMKNTKSVTASVHVSWLSPKRKRTLQVQGTKGSCFIDYVAQTCTLSLLEQPAKIREEEILSKDDVSLSLKVETKMPLSFQLDQVANALSGKPHHLASVSDALQSVVLAEEALASAHK